MIVCQNDSKFQCSLSFFLYARWVKSAPVQLRAKPQFVAMDENTVTSASDIGTLSMSPKAARRTESDRLRAEMPLVSQAPDYRNGNERQCVDRAAQGRSG
jgi:hypothetical protein